MPKSALICFFLISKSSSTFPFLLHRFPYLHPKHKSHIRFKSINFLPIQPSSPSLLSSLSSTSNILSTLLFHNPNQYFSRLFPPLYTLCCNFSHPISASRFHTREKSFEPLPLSTKPARFYDFLSREKNEGGGGGEGGRVIFVCQPLYLMSHRLDCYVTKSYLCFTFDLYKSFRFLLLVLVTPPAPCFTLMFEADHSPQRCPLIPIRYFVFHPSRAYFHVLKHITAPLAYFFFVNVSETHYTSSES